MPSKPEVLKKRRENDPEYAERLRGYTRKHREKNLESERERDRISANAKRSENREAYNTYMREWTAKNKDSINAKRRDRLLNDVDYAERLREIERKRYATNPDGHRSVRLKSTYGITLEDYMKMYVNQNGKCAICSDEKPNNGREGLVVDHCHKEGHIRKLLCAKCNTGLGQFRDSVSLLENAIKYLKG